MKDSSMANMSDIYFSIQEKDPLNVFDKIMPRRGSTVLGFSAYSCGFEIQPKAQHPLPNACKTRAYAALLYLQQESNCQPNQSSRFILFNAKKPKDPMGQHPYLSCEIECACDALNASKAGRKSMPVDDLRGGLWQRRAVTPSYAYELTYTVRNVVQGLCPRRHSACSMPVGAEKVHLVRHSAT